MIKNYNDFISESETQDETKMPLREVKLKFLNELISAGVIKPTINPDGFQRWLDNNVK